MPKISSQLRIVLAGLALLLMGNLAAQSNAETDCQCRDSQGSMQNLGTVVCVDITGNQYMVRCEMSQNTPYWKRLSEKSGCPQARSSGFVEALSQI